jgi:hypothetical protein
MKEIGGSSGSKENKNSGSKKKKNKGSKEKNDDNGKRTKMKASAKKFTALKMRAQKPAQDEA